MKKAQRRFQVLTRTSKVVALTVVVALFNLVANATYAAPRVTFTTLYNASNSSGSLHVVKAEYDTGVIQVTGTYISPTNGTIVTQIQDGVITTWLPGGNVTWRHMGSYVTFDAEAGSNSWSVLFHDDGTLVNSQDEAVLAAAVGAIAPGSQSAAIDAAQFAAIEGLQFEVSCQSIDQVSPTSQLPRWLTCGGSVVGVVSSFAAILLCASVWGCLAGIAVKTIGVMLMADACS